MKTPDEPADGSSGEPMGIPPASVRRKSLRLAHGNLERAEDLEHQVEVRVWETTRQQRPDEIRSLTAFKHGVLVNVHREATREDRRHRHSDIHSPAVAQGVLGRPLDTTLPEDPSQAAERGELFRLVRRAIQKLTDTSRMVVRMRYFDDLQQRQIARELKTNEVNVSRILKRARDRLRGLLG